jgi:hypothetical protein
MSQLENIAMKSFNHFVEMADGNMKLARSYYLTWVGENAPHIGEAARHSWVALTLTIDWLFQEASEAQ